MLIPTKAIVPFPPVTGKTKPLEFMKITLYSSSISPSKSLSSRFNLYTSLDIWYPFGAFICFMEYCPSSSPFKYIFPSSFTIKFVTPSLSSLLVK